jgi:hypothetical protein
MMVNETRLRVNENETGLIKALRMQVNETGLTKALLMFMYKLDFTKARLLFVNVEASPKPCHLFS